MHSAFSVFDLYLCQFFSIRGHKIYLQGLLLVKAIYGSLYPLQFELNIVELKFHQSRVALLIQKIQYK